MAKTNASFNLSKSVKRVMGTILNKDRRAAYKNFMVDAEWDYQHKRHIRPKDNTNNTREAPGE